MAKKQFKAESKRLLDLMVNSIYTHKEIFLRELISNASDAEDKLAYKALTDDQVPVDRSELKITIVPDKEMRTLTVSDNGVGMSKEDLESNLGTIAKSGSFQFKQDLAKEDKPEDIDVIGQFGVGFYSAFMVADHVTVISKAYGSDQAYMWQSDGADGYTVTECEKDTVGTDVIMHIKANVEDENYDQYLETYKLQELIKKYSDYIRYPIVMEVEDYRQKEKPADAGEDYKPEWETVKEWKTINSMVPLWQRPKAQVKPEEYNNFYKEKFMDWQDPLAVIHTSAEGAVTYKALLYIPEKAPYDFYTREYQKGLQLYSSGVLIMDKCADLLPDYFRTDTFLPIVQQEAVSVTVVAALMGEPACLAVLGVTHSRYVHRSCVCSFPGAVRKMLSTFCLTMPYSFNFCFASLYCADSRSRSASSFLYSVLRAYRLGSFVTPASLSVFAAASYKISWLSCCRRNAALSLAFRSSSATGRSCL